MVMVVVMSMVVIVMMVVTVVVVVVMMVMVVLLRVRPLDRLAVLEHTEPGAHESSARGLTRLDGDPGQAEPSHYVEEHLDRHTQIQASPQKHVPRDAAAAIQVIDPHGGVGYHAPFALSFKETQRPWLPRTTWSTRRSPTISAASAIRRVKRTSSALGDGSPLGWVWNR